MLEAPSSTVTLSGEKLIDMYKDMVTVRRLEMASDALYKAKKIRGLYVKFSPTSSKFVFII